MNFKYRIIDGEAVITGVTDYSVVNAEIPSEVDGYEDNNGNKRKAVEIIAEQVSFCGSKGENAAKADSDYLEIPEVADEDLPF